MLKKIFLRPYFYLFTMLFILIITVSIGYLLQKRLFAENQYYDNWFAKQLSSVNNSSILQPIYLVSDIFDVLKYSLFISGIEVRNLKNDYDHLKTSYLRLKEENYHLAEVLKYKPHHGKIIATARLLSDPNSFGAGVFNVSVGHKEGVQFGDIVTTQNGLVGKIVKVYPNISTVLPVRHFSAKTIGRIHHQGSLVLISGRHHQGNVIDYVSNAAGMKKGQKILTVSDGVSMPSGINIGTIVDPSQRPVKVALNVDFSKLDYVTIIRNQLLKNDDKNQMSLKLKDKICDQFMDQVLQESPSSILQGPMSKMKL